MKLLEKVDNYFYEKNSKKEFYYSIGAIVLALGFVIYYYVFPIVNQLNEHVHKEYSKLNSTIKATQMEIMVLKAQNIRFKNKLKEFNENIKKLYKEKSVLSDIINVMDFARFNEFKWAGFVKNVISDANMNGLKVQLVDNKIFNNEGNISDILSKKMSIGLELNGNYINLINFIYRYENRKDLIRVEKIDIKDKNNYYVKFVLYGYEK